MNQLTKVSNLEETLSPFNISQRIYLLALLKGYGEGEAHDISNAIGAIDRYLIEPNFGEMRQYILDNGWGDKREVDRVWKDTISSHYMELVILAGIKEITSNNPMKDKTVLKEATRCAISHRGKNEGSDGSYDEMVLKRHIQK